MYPVVVSLKHCRQILVTKLSIIQDSRNRIQKIVLINVLITVGYSRIVYTSQILCQFNNTKVTFQTSIVQQTTTHHPPAPVFQLSTHTTYMLHSS